MREGVSERRARNVTDGREHRVLRPRALPTTLSYIDVGMGRGETARQAVCGANESVMMSATAASIFRRQRSDVPVRTKICILMVIVFSAILAILKKYAQVGRGAAFSG